MVVVVALFVFVVVFEAFVAPFEAAFQGEVGVGVELDSDGVVVIGEDGDLVGETALDHGGPFGDDYDSGLVEPVEDYGFDGVVAAAKVVFDLVLGERLVAFVGDLVAVAVDPDLYDVDFFAGEDHALVGDEADAFGIGVAVLRKLSGAGVFDDESGGCSAEEGGGAAFDGHVFAMEPGVSAECGDHLVEEDAAALLGGFAGGLDGAGAGDVARLGVGVEGGQGESEGEKEWYGFHWCSGSASVSVCLIQPIRTAPPLTLKISPEMKPARGVHRKRMGPASSSTWAGRPRGMVDITFLDVSGSLRAAADISVATQPGATQLQ